MEERPRAVRGLFILIEYSDSVQPGALD